MVEGMAERGLRVLLIVNWATHSGGAEVQLLHLARGLAADGHEVTLCCIYRSDLEPRALAGTGIELVELGIQSRARRLLAVFQLAKLARGADIVHCTMWDPSLWGRLAAILARRPAVVADHATDRSVQLASTGESRARWIALHNRLLDRFTFATVACATSQREVLIGEGVDAEKIVHIPNGIPIEQVRAGAAGGPTRGQLGLPADARVAIQIGAFRREKNQLGALEAFEAVRREVPDAQLVFVGDGEMLDEVRSRATEMGADWAHFLGYRPDATAVLAEADLLLQPSWSDAMPMTVIESMALGVPVLASDVGDVRVMLGDAGACVPVGDEEALARECVRMLTDEGLRAKLGTVGRERAQAYDSARMVHRYEALFAAAVAGRPPIPAVAAAG